MAMKLQMKAKKLARNRTESFPRRGDLEGADRCLLEDVALRSMQRDSRPGIIPEGIVICGEISSCSHLEKPRSDTQT